jgi:hypothetical protein
MVNNGLPASFVAHSHLLVSILARNWAIDFRPRWSIRRDDAFLPLLPAIDGQSHAVGPRSPPSTWRPGVDVSPVSVYHLTWMVAQLSKFWRLEGRGYLRSPVPCRSSPIAHTSGGFERTGRTQAGEADRRSGQRACLSAGGLSAAPLGSKRREGLWPH